MKKSIFNNIVRKNPIQKIDGSVSGLRTALREIESSASLRDKSIASSALGLENYGTELAADVFGTITETIDSLLNGVGKTSFGIEQHQIQAAGWASLLATDPVAYANAATNLVNPFGDKGIAIVQSPGANLDGVGLGLEDYAEVNRDVQMSSLLFNLLGSTNDGFTNMFFPTVLVDPSEIGVKIDVNVDVVMNHILRNHSGAFLDWGRANLTRSYVDGSILNNRFTDVIPRYRPTGNGSNAQWFADPTLVPSETIQIGGGRTAVTSSLRLGTEIELLSINQANEELANGPADQTDTLAPELRLRYLDILIGDDVFRVDTRFRLGSEFTPAYQNDESKMVLNFDSDGLVIKQGRLTLGTKQPSANPLIADNNIRLRVNITGSAFTDTGLVRADATTLEFIAAQDAELNALAEADHDAIADLFKDAKVVGWGIEAAVDNLNLRFNGLLIDSKRYSLYIPVPYKSPMSKIAPISTAANTYESDLATLISAHHIAGADQAIDRLEEVCDTLKDYVAVTTRDGITPALNCAGAYHVKATYREREVSFADITDGRRSAERAEDVRLAIFEYIHAMALELKIASEYSSALKVVTGNQSAKPTLCIGTDETIYSYLTSKAGNLIEREEYNIRIECTPNKRVRGLIYLTFSNLAPTVNSADKPTVFAFGNHFYSPVITTNVAKTVGGAKSNHLTTAPRREFAWHLPILGVIKVTNTAKIAGKLPVNVNKVD